VDLALTLEPKAEEKLVFDPVFEDELVFLMSPAIRGRRRGW
jgi:hypothetical protein